jgi:hypothetical protein
MSDLGNLLKEIRDEEELKRRRSVLESKRRLIRIGGRAWRKRLREAKEAKDRELELQLRRARTQQKYYLKNRERLNRERAMRQKRPHEVYTRAKARAERRGQEWKFSYEDWVDVWDSAPRVWNPRKAFYDTAWNMKGGNYRTDTQMCRIDTDGPWATDNVFIGINGHPLEEPEDVRA